MLEYSLGSDNFVTSLDGYDALINIDKEYFAKCDQNGWNSQGLPYYTELYSDVDNINEEKLADPYDQYIVDEVVLPDHKGDKRVGKVKKCVKYSELGTGEVWYTPMHNSAA